MVRVADIDDFQSSSSSSYIGIGLFWFLCGNEVYTDRISAK